ncbi:hypothetical protein PAXRUDRAFT_166292, partial [Paxillus rubicundulus Ve08.2h10]
MATSVGSSGDSEGTPIGSEIGIPSVDSSDCSGGHAELDKVRVRYARRHPTQLDLQDLERLIIFNTKDAQVDEVWQELEYLISSQVFQAIMKVKRVTYRNRLPCVHVWIKKDFGAPLVRLLRGMTRERTPQMVCVLRDAGYLSHEVRWRAVSSWRFAIWQSWRDRHPEDDNLPRSERILPRERKDRVATWNINGFPSKKHQVIDFLHEQSVAICALQETLVSATQYPIQVSGYVTFALPWVEGFRGWAILVDSSLPAYLVHHADDQLEGYRRLLHVKVNNFLPDKKPLHVLAVYLPSGGNFRSARKQCYSVVQSVVDGIKRRESDAHVLILGDFNDTDVSVDKWNATLFDRGLKRLRPVGSPLTRFPVREQSRSAAIDHMVSTEQTMRLLSRSRV